MRSEKDSVHGNMSRFYPSLEKETKQPQPKFFQYIQMHEWHHESHENRALTIIFFLAFSYFENHGIKYSQRHFIIFLTLLSRHHRNMFEQE
jgi:hypothetical protein